MNTTRKVIVSILATSFLGATALPTLAQQSGGSGQKAEKRMAHKGSDRKGGNRKSMRQAFERYDGNKDGVITQDEVDAIVAERFAEIAGPDGTITLDQYRDAWTERSNRRQVRSFQRLDRDGDGSVTQSEYDNASDRMFSRLDRDGNGELTIQRPDGRKADKGSKGHRKMGRGGHGNVTALMERFDVDKDGKITRAEFDEVRAGTFSGADADNSGGVTLEEFTTIWQDLNSDRITRGFQRLDADGDLAITQEEYAARSENFVEKHDRNGDGVVTKADRRGGKDRGKKSHRSMKKSGGKDMPKKKASVGKSNSGSSSKALDI